MIGLMKYNHKKNLLTDHHAPEGEKNRLAPCPIQLPPTSPPGGVCSRIRLLEYVRTSRDATTGRISSGLHGTARAALRYGSGGTLPRASPEPVADRYY